MNHSSDSASSSSIYDIPLEVINEILLYMDVKTLLRLRCVSRWWNDHISSLTFCLLHYRHSQYRGLTQLQICQMKERGQYIFFSIDVANPCHRNVWSFNYSEKAILKVSKSSCFNLLCLYGLTYSCIYNPTIRSKVIDLPQWNYLGWYPMLEIGFVHSTNKFKVLRFSAHPNNLYHKNIFQCVEFKVLTIPDDLNRGWRAVSNPPSEYIVNPVIPSAESAFYMLKCDSQQIFRFDLEIEQWSEVKLPPLSDKSLAKIAEFQGRLCLVVKKLELLDEIWLLKDRDEWVKRWVLNPSPLNAWYTPLYHDEEQERIVMLGPYAQLYNYQIAKGTYEKSPFLYISEFKYLQSTHYVETIVSSTTLRNIAAAKH